MSSIAFLIPLTVVKALSLNEKLQYTAVLLAILAASIYIAVKAYRAAKRKGSPCCGCSLAQSCNKSSRNIDATSCNDAGRQASRKPKKG